jgi:hypothetical protein
MKSFSRAALVLPLPHSIPKVTYLHEISCSNSPKAPHFSGWKWRNLEIGATLVKHVTKYP